MITHTADGRVLVHIHQPKCGGVSVWQIVSRPAGVTDRVIHATAAQWRHGLGDRRFNAAYKFTIVRHPIDRCLSAWTYLHQQTEEHTYWRHDATERAYVLPLADSFDEFMAKCPDSIATMAQLYPHFVRQAYWTTINGKVAVDSVLRFESLDDDWGRLMAMCGSTAELPMTNATRHGDWRECVSESAQDRIRTLYARDFELFYPAS